MAGDRCETCKWWRRVGNSDRGECHCHAPAPILPWRQVRPDDWSTFTVHPTTPKDDVCRDYVKKPPGE